MNSTHVIYTSAINNIVKNVTKNVSEGVTFFWINTTLYINNVLKAKNGTNGITTYVLFVNSTFFWFRVNLSDIVIDHKIWIGDYGIITRHWWYSRPVKQTLATKSVSEGEQRLIEWWSPKFLEENETTITSPVEEKGILIYTWLILGILIGVIFGIMGITVHKIKS